MPRRHSDLNPLIEAFVAMGKAETPPRGWLSINQIVAATGATYAGVKDKLKSGEYRGCPRRKFRIKIAGGKLVEVMHYDTTWTPGGK